MRPTSTEHDGLDPIEPADALRLYLDHEETEYSKNTVQAHRHRLEYFVQWYEEVGLTNLNELTGRHLQEYRLWRKEHGDFVQISLNEQVHGPGVRQVVWLHRGGPPGALREVRVPRVSPEQQRRDEALPTETAREILDNLSRFPHASIQHALIALFWET